MNNKIDIEAITENVVKKMFAELNNTDEHELGFIKTVIDISANVTTSILKAYHEAATKQ